MKELLKIQGKLKAPKGQFNSFGKYNYRSCEDILEAVKPLCIEEGVLLTITDDVVAVGNRVYIKATATVTKGSETLSVSAFAREAETKKGMDDSQVTGASSSYARKYALNGLFCIDDSKDADSHIPTKEYINSKQLGSIMDYINQLGVDTQKFLSHFKVKTVADLTQDQYEEAIAILKKKEEVKA